MLELNFVVINNRKSVITWEITYLQSKKEQMFNCIFSIIQFVFRLLLFFILIEMWLIYSIVYFNCTS